MPNLTDSDLRDPSPPIPGDAQRTAVAARANQLGRKRRMMQGAGALGMVAVVAVGVAALTAGGTSGSNTGRIEAAGATVATNTADVVVPDPAVTATVPAPATTVPAATVDTTPAPAAAAPSTFTVSGTVGNIPAGVTLTLTLSGSGGTFTATADASGNYSMSGVPAGEYETMYEWSSTDGTATSAGKPGTVTISGDSNFSFDLQ